MLFETTRSIVGLSLYINTNEKIILKLFVCWIKKKRKSKKLYKRPFCLPRFFLTIKKKQFYNSLLIRKELNELVKANTSFDWDLSPNLKLTMSLWHEMKEDRLFGVFISYLQLNLIRFFAYLQISVQHKKIWACK